MAQDRADVEAIAADAKKAGLSLRMVRVDEDGAQEQLRAFLERKWRQFPPMAKEGAA